MILRPKRNTPRYASTYRIVSITLNYTTLQWTDDEFINFVETRSDENYSDSLSTPTGRTTFYKHSIVFMGHIQPEYTSKLPLGKPNTALATVPALSPTSSPNPNFPDYRENLLLHLQSKSSQSFTI